MQGCVKADSWTVDPSGGRVDLRSVFITNTGILFEIDSSRYISQEKINFVYAIPLSST